MEQNLNEMVCYRLDGELKTQLLTMLANQKLTLSNFHRSIVQTALVRDGLTASVLRRIKADSECYGT
jgi:hypothetical protein